MISAIITAGGSSNRYGKDKNKLLENINSKTVIEHALGAFLSVKEIEQIVICANPSIIDDLNKLFKDSKVGIPAHADKIKIIEGGKTRQESVYNGLNALENCDYVLIHDGARPMISTEIIKKAIEMVKDKKALTVAAKTIDTIKQVDENLMIIKTIDRSSLYNTQTPQAFEYKLIKNAHEKLKGQDFTDDCGMLESLGVDVFILEGDYKNIKITTKPDIEIAKAWLS